ncbi:MAG: hypothetical protein JST38_11735 [Bacteroidetes bacterium]|nr:hypothetical protein [Bacteroidota bacterium]MBS1941533.1 hypothetical protein [Bacteroidota bacterium]
MEQDKLSSQLGQLLKAEENRLGQTEERLMLIEALEEFKRLVEEGMVKPRGNTLLPMDKRFVEVVLFNSAI